MFQEEILHQVEGIYRITALKPYRKTAGVIFDAVPIGILPSIQAIDRVIHDAGAYSPGTVENIIRPWYMHQSQEDNLIVLAGFRDIELFRDGRFHRFRLTPQRLEIDGAEYFDRPVMLSWTTRVFHRIVSSPDKGSASINLAVRHPDFDLKTNFNIYDLDTKTGAFRIIRSGHLDQSGE